MTLREVRLERNRWKRALRARWVTLSQFNRRMAYLDALELRMQREYLRYSLKPSRLAMGVRA